MTVAYIPSGQTKILWSADVDWWHKDTKWPQSRQATRGNLTLTWCHTSPLWNFSLIGQRNIILFRSNSSHFNMFDWRILGWCLFTFVRFPTKTVWSPLSFSVEVSTFLWILKRSNLQKLLCPTVLINFAIFLEKKNKSKFPVRSKVRRNGQAGTGLER